MSFILLGILNSQAAAGGVQLTEAHEHIATLNPAGSSSGSFTNIPADYEMLLVTWSFLSNNQSPIEVEFNGDSTGNNHNDQYLAYFDNSFIERDNISDNYIRMPEAVPRISFTDAPGVGSLLIANYTNANKYKDVIARWGSLIDETSTGFMHGLYKSTSNITSVNLSLAGTTLFLSGSEANLYGLKGA